MLLTLFSGLYELITGSNQNVPDYVSDIYDTVGLITLIIVIIVAAIFYIGIGRWKPVFIKTGHWIFTLIVLMIASFSIAFGTAKDVIGEVDSYMYRFSFMNALFSLVLFLILSFIFKSLSIFAKRTPF
jgi:hypothetical protein